MDNFSLKYELVNPEDVTEENSEVKEMTIEETQEVTIDADFNNSRKKLHDILDVGSKAIDELGKIAKQSQDPLAYSALASLIKNVSEVSSNLLKIRKELRDNKVNTNNNSVTQNKNTLMADTMQIAKLLKENK